MIFELLLYFRNMPTGLNIFWATSLLQEHANWTQWSLEQCQCSLSVTRSFLYEISLDNYGQLWTWSFWSGNCFGCLLWLEPTSPTGCAGGKCMGRLGGKEKALSADSSNLANQWPPQSSEIRIVCCPCCPCRPSSRLAVQAVFSNSARYSLDPSSVGKVWMHCRKFVWSVPSTSSPIDSHRF